MAKITIAELDLNTDALTKKATQTKKAIQDLKDAQKILKIQGEQNSKEFVKNEVALKKLTTSYREQTKVLSSLTNENDEFIKTEQGINNAVNKNITTISQARKSNKELLALRNELNLSTVEGQKQLTRINAKLDSNNKFIKENVSGYEKQKIGIGNYTGALDRFFPRLGRVVRQGLEFKDGLVQQRQAMMASNTAVGAGSKALRLFRIALISTGIGAIVVALGTLIAAFSSTQSGLDEINKALAPIKGAFQGIIGVIQDISLNVFGQLGDRFSIVKNGILIGIDTIRLGWNKLTGDQEEAAEIQSRIIERTKELTEAQARLNEKNAKLVQIWKGAGERISDAAKAQEEIERLTISIEKGEASLVLTRAKTRKQLRELQLIANDRSKTAQENNDAADKAIVIAKNLAQEEKNLVALKVKQEELRQSQNDTDRKDLKKLNELKAEAIAADEKAAASELKFLTAKSNLKKQLAKQDLDNAKKQTDLLIDQAQTELDLFKSTHQKKLDANTFFNDELLKQEQDRLDALLIKELEYQKLRLDQGVISEQEYNEAVNKVNEDDRLKRDEAKALREEAEREKKIIDLENQRIIDEENFKTQFEVQTNRLETQRQKELEVAKRTGADIDIIKTKFKNREKKLDDLAEKQKRKNAVDTFGEIAGLLGQQSALGKAAALVQAGINIEEGITKAIAQGGLAGIATGAVVAAKGAISIAKIASFDSGGKVADVGNGKITTSANIPTQQGGDNILATVKTGEVILNQEQQQRAGGSAFFASIGVPGFNNGGITGANNNITAPIQKANADVTTLANQIVEGINNVKIVTVVDDVTNAQAVQSTIVSGADI